MKFFFVVIACIAYTGNLSAQDTALLAKQQGVLKAALAGVDKKLEDRAKLYYDAQAKKVKYDTIGLAQWRYEMKLLKDDRRRQEIAFIKAHPDYIASADALKDAVGYLPDDISIYDRVFKGLSKAVQKSKEGISVKKTIDAFMLVRIGAAAPLFTQPDTAGHAINLKDFRGKYVLLDFWASWCGPCREENPNVVKAYQQFRDKNFTVLSVSLDKADKKDAWIKAINDDSLTWNHVSDLKYWDNAVAKLYAIRSVPQNFLIDPGGTIVAANLRGEELIKKLQELILH
ncbi:alkyl hydroperoxide reductase [Niastella koreensis]|uniref:Alkyl hydroperoxide reductase/ Thiol specific antioxidant/ Mal allergen n=2 Tax=Niastella koreensis TaxID=354356 RepID=G8TC34_NIAKG|nr:TlpA disulfide reductase family protein [Niastella koreensis]AEW00341.1 alkyl hydroperoxide reductase/ Thiol specific antioxidant/ Mal allergen [Niastella koreensis GR20-10]OQP52208.1 alkyl hydroperoxide reductase [Niastella koreensis]